MLPYLHAIGIGSLDALIVTHSNSGHSGGAASVLAALLVRRVLSSVPAMTGEACVAGQEWAWEGVRFMVLHPAKPAAAGKGDKPNYVSCVLRVEAGGRVALLTSDIEAIDERALLARDAAALRADVLLVLHHGSRTSSTPEFVTAVGARELIYPVAYRNRFGHPRSAIMARYGDAHVRRSDRDGAVRVVLDEITPVLSAWREERRRYWYGR